MNLLRRYPWIPLAVLFLGFVAVWIAWLITAIKHAPESVAPTPAPAHESAR